MIHMGDDMKIPKTNLKHLPLKRKLRNWAILLLVLLVACVICILLRQSTSGPDFYVSLIFVLAVMVISLLTDGYVYGVVASIISVIGTNYAFTYPYMELNFSIYGYPITFLTMFAVSVVISTLSTSVREGERIRHDNQQAQLRANLLRSVSHDLRTPLTSIIGSIGTVVAEGEHLSSGERNLLLNDAKNDAEWLVRIVENLLSITRISGSEQANISRSPELIEEILGECCQNFKKRNPDIALDIRIPPEPVIVSVDPLLIEQVLMNLLDNSVHHGVNVTHININVTLNGAFANVAVADDGVGIDPKVLPDLFKGQLSPSDQNKFRGIGLSVCQTIINAHNGKITARNLPKCGCEFTFTLPLEEAQNEYS